MFKITNISNFTDIVLVAALQLTLASADADVF